MKRTSPFDSPATLKAQKKNQPKFNIAWQDHGKEVKGHAPLLYLDGPDITPSEKIAGFDMDGTLIVTQSGKTFPTGPEDWKLFNNKVAEKLKELRTEGFKVVLFTNQMGIEKKKTNPADLKTKIKAISQELGFPLQVFISTGENEYRKPGINQWTYMVEKCNGGKSVDHKESFYVGDAAGRVKDWTKGKKKDFSCSDRKFAANLKLKFYTPEEYFNGEKECTKFEWGSLDARALLKNKPSVDHSTIASKTQEMLILVGLPAAGKSTFARTYLQTNGYVIVNRDELKTQDKCKKMCTESLKNKKSVVIDNTNPNKESRKEYIELAKKAGVAVRCLHIHTPKELAEHLNMFRQAQSNGAQRRVPAIGFNIFKSKFEAPDVAEGFTEVKTIDFVPKFKSSEDKALFKMWT